jgi:hypothetical protein
MGQYVYPVKSYTQIVTKDLYSDANQQHILLNLKALSLTCCINSLCQKP